MTSILIMAGGSGERFWPLSTKEKPKQLLSIFTSKPLIKMTYDRILPLTDKEHIFVATNAVQLPELKKAIPDLEDDRIIIEPLFKDTAAAIGYGSLIIAKYYPGATIAVLASDHNITEEDEFRKVMLIAAEEAQNDHIVTLGITPTYPETGYGYIEVAKAEKNKPTKSLGFQEKPNWEIANEFFTSKRYLWNSGMFVFKYSTIMAAFKKYAPNHFEILQQIDKCVESNKGLKTTETVKPYFEKFEKKSIDFAIMEKADNIYVIPSSFGWSDVGSFEAFDELFPKDENGNVIKSTRYVTVDSSNNILIGSKIDMRVSLLGIKDKVVVYTDKEILICEKSRAQEIKKILAKIKD